jgi:CRISPR-associated protein Csm5
MQPFTVHPLVLTPLSPIHIGSGVELDWTQAVLDGRRMVLFDPTRATLPDAALRELAKAAVDPQPGNAMIGLQKQFKAHQRALVQAGIGEIALTVAVASRFSKALGTNRQAAQGGPAVVNSLSLARHASDSANCLYVPGTSLKGALRTAEVARLHAAENPGPHREPNRDQKDPSDLLLGDFSASSFARVMVADFAPRARLAGMAAEVQCTRRRWRKDASNDLVKVVAELIQPFAAGSQMGEIRIAKTRSAQDKNVDLCELMRTTHAFHHGLFQESAEILEAERRDTNPDWLPRMRELLSAPEAEAAFRDGRAALVRLGKFCSAESKTVAWRSVKNSKARDGGPITMLNSTTIWLADLGAQGRLPLGWALLELGDEPSAAVRAFCEAMGGIACPSPEPEPPARDTIVPDAPDNPRLKDLALLEAGYDQGKPNDMLLERRIRESKAWPAADRLILAQLVAEKARRNSKLPGFKWKELDTLLLPWPPE